MLLVIIMEACFALLIFRLFSIQYIQRDKYQKNASKQCRIILKSKVKRGKIYSRNMREIAVNRDMVSFWADPTVLNISPQEVTALIAPSLNLEPSWLEAQLNRKDTKFIWLKRRLDYGSAMQIQEKLDEKNVYGIGVMMEEKRSYPKGKLASHVIGYTNFDDEWLTNRIPIKGVCGVEKYHDDLITFYEEDAQSLSTDAFDRPIRPSELKSDAPFYNNGIVLTIDELIQYTAEVELTTACEKLEAKGGAVIVMNPRTGAVLALANYPNFDLNSFSQEDIDRGAMQNKAIWGRYEPGSVFKIVTVAAVLDDGAVSLTHKEDCENGAYKIYGHTIHDKVGYGKLTLSEIIEKSSNIGMVKVASHMEKARLDKYIRNFGFGKKTGIDLPFESKGNLKALEKWGEHSMAFVPFGQGITVTPLQMLCAMNAIANDGIIMKPHVTKAIVNGKGEVISTTIPEVSRKVISRSTAQVVKEMLIRVVEYGTGGMAKVGGFDTPSALNPSRTQPKGYLVAGKTGTAQKAEKGAYSKEKSVSSFAGFLPAEDPKLSIIVLIDEPKGEDSGGKVAAPVFKAIAEKAMRHIEIQMVYSSPNR